MKILNLLKTLIGITILANNGEALKSPAKQGTLSQYRNWNQNSPRSIKLARSSSGKQIRNQALPDAIYSSSLDAMNQNKFVEESLEKSDSEIRRRMTDIPFGNLKWDQIEREGSRLAGYRSKLRYNPRRSDLFSNSPTRRSYTTSDSFRQVNRRSPDSDVESFRRYNAKALAPINTFGKIKVKPLHSMKTVRMTQEEFDSLESFNSASNSRWPIGLSTWRKQRVGDGDALPFFESVVNKSPNKNYNYDQLRDFRFSDLSSYEDQIIFKGDSTNEYSGDEHFNTKYSHDEFEPSDLKSTRYKEVHIDDQLDQRQNKENTKRNRPSFSYGSEESTYPRRGQIYKDRGNRPSYRYRENYDEITEKKVPSYTHDVSYYEKSSNEKPKVDIKPEDVVTAYYFKPPVGDEDTSRGKRKSYVNKKSKIEKDSFFKEYEQVDHYPKSFERSIETTTKNYTPIRRRKTRSTTTSTTTERSATYTSGRNRHNYRKTKPTATTETKSTTEHPYERRRKTTDSTSTTTATRTTTKSSVTEGLDVHNLAGPPYQDSISLDKDTREKYDVKYDDVIPTTTTTTEKTHSYENRFGGFKENRDEFPEEEKEIYSDYGSEEPFVDPETKSNYRRRVPVYTPKTRNKPDDQINRNYRLDYDRRVHKLETQEVDSPNKSSDSTFRGMGKFDDKFAFNSFEYPSQVKKTSFSYENKNDRLADDYNYGLPNRHQYDSKKQTDYKSRNAGTERKIEDIFEPSTNFPISPAFNEFNGGGIRHIDDSLGDFDQNIEHVKYENLEEYTDVDPVHAQLGGYENLRGNIRKLPGNMNIKRQRGHRDGNTDFTHEDHFSLNSFGVHHPHVGAVGLNLNYRGIGALSSEYPSQPHHSIFPAPHPTYNSYPSPLQLSAEEAERISSIGRLAAEQHRNQRFRLPAQHYPGYSQGRREADAKSQEDDSWSVGNMFRIPDSIGDIFGRKK